ncbi:hypothetical protein DPMN_015619 [Dreissena polymorpha]|uniref:Uncharacterized protein n=1 Tax=Dreissena polymorpha TaxID=45954 RepID=A0A9D4N9H9_DREPO|nr:hypothetical protein DPMN_015619 [Dreissena polymorpha]
MLTRAPTLHNCIVDSVGPYQTATLSRLVWSYSVCCHNSTNLAQLYSGQRRSLPDSYIEQAGLYLLCILTRAPTLHNCIVDSVGPYQTASLSRLVCSYSVL